MIYCRKLPARIVPVIASVSASFGVFAACGEPAEATLIESEVQTALAMCSDEASCDEASTPEPGSEEGAGDGDWGSRCTSDDQCAIGECVCGICSESCNGEPDACSGLPDGATCYSGRSLPRAALCHATTVPGICLLPCSTDDECGAGLVCALGVCLPEPETAGSEQPAPSAPDEQAALSAT